jgi:hypothetical protein
MDFPYSELTAEMGRGPWSVWSQLAISPVARVQDRDDHVLRGILAKADTDGVTARLKLGVRYTITPRWAAEAGVGWTSWATEGTSHNQIYSGDEGPPGQEWWIEERIQARFLDVWIALVACF